MNSGITKNLL